MTRNGGLRLQLDFLIQRSKLAMKNYKLAYDHPPPPFLAAPRKLERESARERKWRKKEGRRKSGKNLSGRQKVGIFLNYQSFVIVSNQLSHKKLLEIKLVSNQCQVIKFS